jgi:hypothetical protein
VRQPSISITAATGVPTYGTFSLVSPPQSGVHEVYTSIDPGCSEKYAQLTNSQGKLPYPGVPYGNYKLCADFSGSYGQLDTFLNSNPAGSTTTIPYKGTNVTCP